MQKCEQTFSRGRRWGARPVQNTWLYCQSDGLGAAAAGDAFEWNEQIQVCKVLVSYFYTYGIDTTGMVM